MFRFVGSILIATCVVAGAKAADYVQPGPLYPPPYYSSATSGQGPIDYSNSYLRLQQFNVLPSGGGTVVTDGWVRSADFFAGSPAYQAVQRTALQAQHGVTATAAMANIWMPSAPGKTAWAVNAATFAGDVGGGFSFAHRLNFNIPVAITGSYGNGAGSAHVGRVGLMGEF
ncbi:MAG: hypothetical protein AB1586_27175 [Pseudomonadota bacterium]